MEAPELDFISRATRPAVEQPLIPGLDMRSTDWHEQALCKDGLDPDAYFRGGEGQVYVKNRCRPCPVRRECMNYALDHYIEDGIWGGLTAHERRRLKEGRPTNWTRVLLRGL